MDKRLLEKMEELRLAVRFDVTHGTDKASIVAQNDLTESLINAGACKGAEEMAHQFAEAQRAVHRATQRILKAVEA